jgi:hypothetical protein
MKTSANQSKKEYLKPEWRKEKLFERFSMACPTKDPCGITARLGYRS